LNVAALLFRHWPEVAARVRKAKRVELFIDFDGTLSPIVGHPNEAAIGQATRDALAALACHPRTDVTIVSGRRRRDLITRIKVPRIRYWGLFGWEQSRRHKIPARAREALRHALR